MTTSAAQSLRASATPLLGAADEAEALELLHDLGCTDGLPVVIPTPERVERLALATGLDPALELGVMGPGGGSATVEKLATSAVMAGCLPEHMPVFIAAVEAVLDERFDCTEMQATTFGTAPLILVNGPARQACGPLASGFGALGPGNRANASIGRALRLAMINIGGGRAGESDMTLLGHPGKFTYCLAEDEEHSPFEPLHVALGSAPEDSLVTVIGAEAPTSVISIVDADDPESAARLLRSIAASLTHPGTNNAVLRGGAAVVILNPDHAQMLADSGYDRKRIQEELVDLCTYRPSDLAPYLASGEGSLAGPGPESMAKDERTLACFSPRPTTSSSWWLEAAGLYTTVMSSWCAGPAPQPCRQRAGSRWRGLRDSGMRQQRALLAAMLAAALACDAGDGADSDANGDPEGGDLPSHLIGTAQGLLEGELVTGETGIRVFRGIPFAAPPVGELRFRPPAPPRLLEGQSAGQGVRAPVLAVDLTADLDLQPGRDADVRELPRAQRVDGLRSARRAASGHGVVSRWWAHGRTRQLPDLRRHELREEGSRSRLRQLPSRRARFLEPPGVDRRVGARLVGELRHPRQDRGARVWCARTSRPSAATPTTSPSSGSLRGR